MTRGQKIGAAIFILSLLAGLGVIGIVVGKSMLGTSAPKPVASVSNSRSDVRGSSDLKVGVSSGLGGGLPEPMSQQTTDSSGGARNGSGSGSPGGSTAAPGPESFAEYEKYKDHKDALFGDIQKGTGNEVTVNKKVAVYYKGYLTNGTLFDQSRAEKPGEQPKPLIFTVGKHEVVVGMEQGVLGMRGGGKRRIIVPPAVGYGERGFGPVPSNSVTIFDVELVDLE